MRNALPHPVARFVDERLRALGRDISVVDRSGTRRYHRSPQARIRTDAAASVEHRVDKLFAVVRPLATRVDVGFYKLGLARSKRILHARGHLPFVPYRVEVEAPGDVDRELLAWVTESYELSLP